MSGSTREVQALADQILALLGVRIRAGELVVRYSDGVVQKCETRTVHGPGGTALGKHGVDKRAATDAH